MQNKKISAKNRTRKVILVDELDRVLGESGLIEAHQGKGLLHRASSVFLFRKTGGRLEFLFQQRSPEKILAAGQWANTVCGNLNPGESYEQCALRRLKEEIGVHSVSLTELTKYRYQAECDNGFSENEMDMIYAGWYDGLVEPNPEEVTQVRWVEWDKNASFIDLFVEPLAPWVKLMFADASIQQNLTQFLKGKS